jgi:hypothetical protein
MGRGGSTSDFFNFIDTQNNAIAARESGEKPPIPDGGDGIATRSSGWSNVEKRQQKKAEGSAPGRAQEVGQ